jgi:phage protein D
MPEAALLPSSVRQPRLRVLANGAPVLGAIEAEIVSNNHYAADHFRLSLAVGADSAHTGSFWTGTPDIQVDLQVTLDTSSWTSLVQGTVDSVTFNPIHGLVVLCGRDNSAPFIETRTQETFANQTSSDIALLLASRHGLSADVQATTTPVGRYWALEHDRITLDAFARATTEWDLLVTLAQHEGFDVWVTGGTLHFRPPVSGVGPSAILRPTATASGPANLTSLRLERALTLARDIEVTVKSWNSRTRTSFVQTARAGGGSKASGKRQRYVYVVPNLTPDDALKLAQRRLVEITQHEWVFEAEMPGELQLGPRQIVLIEGTGTPFDQPYFIDEIERHLHVDHGFTQRLRAKTLAAGSQATSPTDQANPT